MDRFKWAERDYDDAGAWRCLLYFEFINIQAEIEQAAAERSRREAEAKRG